MGLRIAVFVFFLSFGLILDWFWSGLWIGYWLVWVGILVGFYCGASGIWFCFVLFYFKRSGVWEQLGAP